MNLRSKKMTASVLLALSLSTCTPVIYAVDEQRKEDVAQQASKSPAMTDDQKDTALKAIGGAIIGIALITAAVVVWRAYKKS